MCRDTACSVRNDKHKLFCIFHNKPYSFEVIKIELLDLSSNSSILDVKVADSYETDLLSVAKILQNVEKSYDKGKFLF